jgi:hypothetical protein
MRIWLLFSTFLFPKYFEYELFKMGIDIIYLKLDQPMRRYRLFLSRLHLAFYFES